MASPLIRKVHVGCRQLGLDTETRHALQRQVTGKDSLTAMSEPELKAVLKALENRGFKPAKKPGHKGAPSADLRFAHKLWSLLGEAGALKHPGRAGLNAFIRARFGASWGSVPADIDMLRDWSQIADLIDALKAMCRRNGIELDR
ncbi:regulatory protein GemA [Rhodobacter sp. NTK016B]|uniref:gp16 family protein n=1 Tax=Rhodobacter sp. NTK016B TaxID=2759676 RepID=UPI001A8E01EA|nr:regulatory protein GemA [Rhodobacter sp. NTK016B]MBN8290565.1 regulatory protein GemA [Rhodobacter sp. NTK016B]